MAKSSGCAVTLTYNAGFLCVALNGGSLHALVIEVSVILLSLSLSL